MSGLTLSLLGPVEATWNRKPLTKFRTTRVQALLVYLAVEDAQGTPHFRREALMDLLWPRMPRKSAQVNLRQTLYQLRKAVPELEPQGSAKPIPFLITDRQTVRINPAYPLKLDIIEFNRFLNGHQEQWHLAVDLYRGDFLAEFYLPDAEPFEEWAGARRAAYRHQVLDAMASLATILVERGDHEQALDYARRQLEIDDLRESGHRQLMTILARLGRRSEALVQYRNLEQQLQRELNVEPSTETKVLREAIREGKLETSGTFPLRLTEYELHDRIGTGSIGTVYRAIQVRLDREVAIKKVLPKYANDPRFIRRFESEAQRIARLEHPRIVPLYDFWREPDSAYLVYRWMDGGSLADSTANGAWEPEAAVRVVDQIAAALHAAHRRGIVHQGLKPSNILLDLEGNAYLSDFGIAVDSMWVNEGTGSREILGMSGYTSPERMQNRPVTPQSDLYNFALVIYVLLTGRSPLSRASSAESHANKQMVPPITATRPDLPHEVDRFIQKAVAEQPAVRFGDAKQLAAALRQALGLAAPQDVHGQFAGQFQLPVDNPYKGLNPFTEADSDLFFGRGTLIEHLLSRLAEADSPYRFLAVVGPSGSGKSSLVRAGLVPALGRGALPGSENWFVVRIQPGPHPFEEVEAALLRVAVNPPSSLLEQVLADERGLLRCAKRVLPGDGAGKLVIIIDQFEEVFTLVQDEAIRRQFLDSLYSASSEPRSPVWVVAVLRADFYDRPLEHPGFSRLMRERAEVIVPLTDDELAQAIQGPAEKVGLRVEPGLVETILLDLRQQPGRLPLLQYALTEHFEERRGDLLTIAGYKRIGGVSGALARRAEEIFAAMDETDRGLSKKLFLRLVTLGEGSEDIRRRVLRSELTAVRATPGQMESIIEAYGRARLLSFDHDPRTRSPTVELAHEALIKEWPRLRAWLDDSRADLRLQKALANATGEWLDAGRDPSYLMIGARLQQFEEWSGDAPVILSGDEQAYLDASLAMQEKQTAEQERRRSARERRRRRTILALTTGLVLAIVLSIFALNQTRIATTQATIAERRAEEAYSRALVTGAERAFSDGRTLEALSLAVEANRIDNPPLDVQETLYRIAYAPNRNDLGSEVWDVRDVAFSPDGRLAVYAGVPNLEVPTRQPKPGLVLADLATREAVWRIEGSTGAASVAFSPDGRAVLAGLWDGTLITHDVVSGDPVRSFYGHSGSVMSVALSPDGEMALSGSTDQSLVLWDVETGTLIQRLEGHRGRVEEVAFSPDGRMALSAGNDGNVFIWDIETGEIIRELGPFDTPVQSAAFHPGGRTALVASGSHSGSPDLSVRPLSLWNIESGRESMRFEAPPAVVFSVAFSLDGRMVLSGDQGGGLILWDSATGTMIRALEGHPGFVRSVAISPDGRVGLSGGSRGNVRTWHLALEDLFVWIEDNFPVRSFTCLEREYYRIEPFCEASGRRPSRTR